ncbi:MAG: phosphoribosylformylglycinamidine synthase [Elusimicrobia bacterium]|nr:phosphoribosylformylglycinamidine synthase [Elusimicrobiota bacterium]
MSVVLEKLALTPQALARLSKERHLSLSSQEIREICRFFVQRRRRPVMAELEMIAQAWSEHTRHKTLGGSFRVYEFSSLRDKKNNGASFNSQTRKPVNSQTFYKQYDNLLSETIFAATKKLNKPWVLSAFKDNAGIIALDDKWAVAVKVETHNHPSALDPYGGASTGIGGVIRDILGCGLGGHPVASIDVFCVEPWKPQVLDGLAAGVRDYGNRMGIPTVAGLVYFDERYKGLPLVYCGTVGLIEREKVEKKGPHKGDLIYLIGGKTGRDGIHGATFSSQKLNNRLTRSVVQIGNPILEKKVWDFLIEADKKELYNSITDLGAGGIACAIWELADTPTLPSPLEGEGRGGGALGVRAALDDVPLKEQALEGWEILVSESQERMMLSVPPGNQEAVDGLLKSFELDFACLGTFVPGGNISIGYQGRPLVDLPLSFLKNVPKKSFSIYRHSRVSGNPELLPSSPLSPGRRLDPRFRGGDGSHENHSTHQLHDFALRLLSSPNIASKERIIRQYDHEVGGRTVIKPLAGPRGITPSDGVVLKPLYGSNKGAAIGLGWPGALSGLDSRAAALAAFDEAIRNVTVVGGCCEYIAVLDNYCAGNTANPKVLSELAGVSEALYEASLAYGVPFISGKDSLNNTAADGRDIPTVVLVTAVGILKDIRRCISVPVKKPGNLLYLIGAPPKNLTGSQAGLMLNKNSNSPLILPDLKLTAEIIKRVRGVLDRGLAVSGHDISDGGLFAALAEMLLGTGFGIDAQIAAFNAHEYAVMLFGETAGRFLFEVPAVKTRVFESAIAGIPRAVIGKITDKPQLKIKFNEHVNLTWPAQAMEKAFRGGKP